MEILNYLKYTKDHEYVRIIENYGSFDIDNSQKIIGFIGITDFAQQELGDLVFIEIETEGEFLTKGETFGTIEAVKTVSDGYMPVSGKILEVNKSIQNEPDIVNKYPYTKGWLIKVELSDPSEIDELLNAEQYEILINQ